MRLCKSKQFCSPSNVECSLSAHRIDDIFFCTLPRSFPLDTNKLRESLAGDVDGHWRWGPPFAPRAMGVHTGGYDLLSFVRELRSKKNPHDPVNPVKLLLALSQLSLPNEIPFREERSSFHRGKADSSINFLKAIFSSKELIFGGKYGIETAYSQV